MRKTTKMVTVLGALCLLALTNYAIAADPSTYVGAQAGNTFEYVMTGAGPWASYMGTFDVTITIDNVTEVSGGADVGMHLVRTNATFNGTSYQKDTVLEADIPNTFDFIGQFVINKNNSNKTIFYKGEKDGNFAWYNGSWDSNGVLQELSMFVLEMGNFRMLVTYSRKSIPGFPVFAILAFTAVAVGFLAKKKCD